MESNCHIAVENIAQTPKIMQRYSQKIEYSIANTIKYNDVKNLQIICNS